MKPYIYKVKPKIKTVNDLLVFVEAIPASRWCVDTRDNDNGQCCVLGHIEKAYGHSWKFLDERLHINSSLLAGANNGQEGRANISPRIPGVKLTGSAIKTRVLKFLQNLI